MKTEINLEELIKQGSPKMEVKVNVTELVYDDIDIIKESIDKGETFRLTIFDSTEEEENDNGDLVDKPAVGIILANIDEDKCCTLMFGMTKENALFFAKAMIAIAESLPNK